MQWLSEHCVGEQDLAPTWPVHGFSTLEMTSF
jgi:hypothetical protein